MSQHVYSYDHPLCERFRQTLALHEEGVVMMRLKLARKFPDETPEEIEQRVRAWLVDKPPPVDAAGVIQRRPWNPET